MKKLIFITLIISSLFFVLFSVYSKTNFEYIGYKKCLECHENLDISIKDTKHRILLSEVTTSSKNGCEACHGAGSVHIEEQDKGVLRFKNEETNQINESCIKCHNSGKLKNWRGSTHTKETLSCISCHNIHKNKEKLLVKEQTTLCIECHKEQKGQINLPSRHPIKENKVNCSSCHNPHEKLNKKGVALLSPCAKCHNEKIGPFIYEHKPVVENCLVCHNSHGSVNQNLINIRQPALCIQCHSDALIFHKNINPSTQKCTECHKDIHGSNQNRRFLK